MHDEPLPRKLNERSGKHLCTRCLAEIPAEEYFGNDHVCDKCAEVIAAELDVEKKPDE